MKQTTKTLGTMGLLAALALAVAFAAAWAGRDEEKKVEEKAKAEKLFSFDKAQARRVLLSRDGKLVADIKRDDEKARWMILQPVHTEADQPAVNAIVDKLETLQQKAELDGMDEKAAGLAEGAPARIEVTIADGSGKSLAGLALGEENSFDSTLFAKKLGEKTLRSVNKADQTPLEKELFDLRDKRVARLDDVTQVQVLEVDPSSQGVLPGGAAMAPGTFGYLLTRNPGGWDLSRPVKGAADPATAERILTQLKLLRATKIAAESADDAALAKFGLAFPKETIALTLKLPGGEAQARTIRIGQPARTDGSVTVKTYAKSSDSPLVYEIDSAILRELSKDLFELQDKSLVKFDREAVRRIDFASPGHETLSIARSKSTPVDGGAPDESFTLLQPQPGPVRKWKASGALFSLGNLKAAAFGEATPADPKGLARFGLDHPRTITAYGDNNVVLAKVLLGGEVPGEAPKPGSKTPPKKRHYAMVEGGQHIVEVDAAPLNDFPQTVQEVLDVPVTAGDAGVSISAGASPANLVHPAE